MRQRWSPTERAILQALDAATSAPAAASALRRIGERVLATLDRARGEIEAWEPVPLEVYGTAALPERIRSSWVFVLRRGVTTGTERHPNSCQRMVSWSGAGDFQVHDGKVWRSHHLASDPRAPLEARWISIPPDTWHQGTNLVLFSVRASRTSSKADVRFQPPGRLAVRKGSAAAGRRVIR